MTPNDPRSPVWGAATAAFIGALAFGAISAVFQFGDFARNGLKAFAVVFAFLTLIGLPGDLVHIARRTPMAARAVGETFWGFLVSAVTLYFAFWAP